jgi:hypothetical protein
MHFSRPISDKTTHKEFQKSKPEKVWISGFQNARECRKPHKINLISVVDTKPTDFMGKTVSATVDDGYK